MSRSLPLFIISALIFGVFSACNSDDDLDYDLEPVVISANTAITAFSLASDDSVLANLDSVFFTIDLNSAQIFNADSLPKGTDVSKLIINITTASASAVDVIYPTEKGDSTINYLEHTTDSIDFSRGPVTVRVTAANTTTKRDYTVRVNVHQMVPDSLYWNQTAVRPLPSSVLVNSVAWQKTVEYKGSAYCFSGTGRTMFVSSISNPYNNNWSTDGVALSFDPDHSSIAASSDALYMLDRSGNLYTSANGLNWTSCGVKWKAIYGGYQNRILGLMQDGTSLKTVTYPATTSAVADVDFPVSGTSMTVLFSTDWQVQPQAIMVGGVKADGQLTGATWAYDGKGWMKISRADLPAREGMCFFPYFTFRSMGAVEWQVTKFTAWIAFGGKASDGKCDNSVYVSLDAGMNWKKADQSLQLPDYIPGMYGAQALVFTSVLNGRSSSMWTPMPDRKLPVWCHIARTGGSRAVSPIEQWDCPYIYVFGGYDEDGDLHDSIWRGVINRLSFKPIQ